MTSSTIQRAWPSFEPFLARSDFAKQAAQTHSLRQDRTCLACSQITSPQFSVYLRNLMESLWIPNQNGSATGRKLEAQLAQGSWRDLFHCQVSNMIQAALQLRKLKGWLLQTALRLGHGKSPIGTRCCSITFRDMGQGSPNILGEFTTHNWFIGSVWGKIGTGKHGFYHQI